MLIISEAAATLAQTLSRSARLPEAGGVRIDVNPAFNSLSMTLAPHPQPLDEVVVAHGARVFLAPCAADRLRRRILLAAIDGGRSAFFLGDA